jgi:hypothetical protein
VNHGSYRLPAIIAAASKAFIRRIATRLKELVAFARRIGEALWRAVRRFSQFVWRAYSRFEQVSLRRVVWLWQLVVALKWFLGLCFIAAFLAYRRLWVPLLMLVAGCGLFAYDLKRSGKGLDANTIDLEDSEHEAERSKLVRLLRVPWRVTLALGMTIALHAWVGFDPLHLTARLLQREKPSGGESAADIAERSRQSLPTRPQDGPEPVAVTADILTRSLASAETIGRSPQEQAGVQAPEGPPSTEQLSLKISLAWAAADSIVNEGSTSGYVRAATVLRNAAMDLQTLISRDRPNPEIRRLLDETNRRLGSLIEACEAENVVNIAKGLTTIPCLSRQ